MWRSIRSGGETSQSCPESNGVGRDGRGHLVQVAGHEVSVAIKHGAPSWLNLLVLVLLWDAIKLNVLAVSVLMRSVLSTSLDESDIGLLC